MKKINLLKIGLIFFVLTAIIFPLKSVIAAGVKGSGDSNKSGTPQTCDSCSVWMSSVYEWGYRIAVYDETTSEYLGKTNVIRNVDDNDFYMVSGNRMRKEFIANHGDYDNIVYGTDNSFVSSSPFVNKLTNFTNSNKKSNFTDVLKSTLNLSGSAGNYVIIDPNTNSKASDGVAAYLFNTFFSQVGLPSKGQEIIDKAKSNHTIYLEVEPLMGWYIRKVSDNNSVPNLQDKRLVLTATEAVYYILEKIGIKESGQQSMVLNMHAAAQFINAHEFAAGDGFYGLDSYPDNFSCLSAKPNYINYCNNLTNLLKGAHNGYAYSGLGVGVWKLSDIITSNCTGECCTPEDFATKPQCKDPSKTPDDGGCKPKYEINSNFKNSCETDGSVGSGYVKDNISWKCVFESDKEDKQPEVQTHYKTEISNPYCTIYCKEEIQTIFPSYGAYAFLGTYLRVSDGLSSFQAIGPVSIIGSVTCRTSSTNDAGHIDIEKFKTDYAAADAAVVTAWNNLQTQVAYKKAKDSISGAYSNSIGVCSSGEKKYYVTDCLDGKSSVTGITGVKCPLPERGPYSGTPSGFTACNPSRTGPEAPCQQIRESNGEDVKHTVKTRSATVSYYGGTATVTETSYDCGVHGTSYSYDETNYTKALTAYNKAVADRTGILNQLKDCNNFLYQYSELNPQLTISYSDSVYGNNVEFPLKVNSSNVTYSNVTYFTDGSSLEESTSGGSTTSSTTKIAIHSCPLKEKYSDMFNAQCGNDTITYVDVPNNKWIESTIAKSFSYKLNENLYNYVVKESGESINYSPTSNIRNYTYLPFGNLPVHFSSTINVDLAYTIHLKSFGEGDKFTNYVFNGKTFNSKYVSGASDYQCWYKVEEDLYLNRGNDIIYRTISLRDPFPGENGTNRVPGYNWRGNEKIDSFSDYYIHNNRGVNEYEVYRLDPMYEIELTPALMRTIQEYNKERNRIESYYYGKSKILGYSDFTLNCKKDGNYKNKECTSNILREWFVKGCAIKGADLSGYSNCGNRTVAW